MGGALRIYLALASRDRDVTYEGRSSYTALGRVDEGDRPHDEGLSGHKKLAHTEGGSEEENLLAMAVALLELGK